jgi:hypothetical protein
MSSAFKLQTPVQAPKLIRRIEGTGRILGSSATNKDTRTLEFRYKVAMIGEKLGHYRLTDKIGE